MMHQNGFQGGAKGLGSIAIMAALALVACAGGPGVATGPGADPSSARGMLVAAAAIGPVPLEVDSVPSVFVGGATEVARVASQAGNWLGASFTPTPFGQGSDRRRLVFRFENAPGSPGEICAGKAALGSLPSPITLHGVFCEGMRPVADASGTAAGAELADADRLVTAVMDRLFPGRSGDYSYGIPGVSLGVGIGSGGHWGIGSGVHF